MPVDWLSAACVLLVQKVAHSPEMTMTSFSPALHYQAYQTLADLSTPMRSVARHLAPWLHHSLFWFPESQLLRKAAGACEVLALAGLTHARPPFNIDKVETEAGTVSVSEEAVFATPFCTLQRFRKEGAPEGEPKVLLVAPASGHFATLLRGTVLTLLRDHALLLLQTGPDRHGLTLAHRTRCLLSVRAVSRRRIGRTRRASAP